MDSICMDNDSVFKDTAVGLSENCGKGTVSWLKLSEEEEIMDDIWIQQSRKKGKEKGSQPSISHLEGLNWEVLVVEGPNANAYCSSSGKLVVYTSLLEHLKTDVEIATVIGREIGSVVARHKKKLKFLTIDPDRKRTRRRINTCMLMIDSQFKYIPYKNLVYLGYSVSHNLESKIFTLIHSTRLFSNAIGTCGLCPDSLDTSPTDHSPWNY
ncbi:PREDICTED: uncharacterized protein LOC104825185 [Tarenaya hassleriana]|uniref:uncharacterized protein LOC104825185 n=1 Tax=Tarenaya hassleriana TaxID=28532 RepID=UPI00053C8354|nr:PREDICTED: uncharacterized protein LOC104825185 [Tarenaya hassleriana]